jgi:predicted double-glycine peptidase
MAVLRSILRLILRLMVLVLALWVPPALAWVEEGGWRGPLPLVSWKEIRDRELSKQQWDFSCGAASLATLLKHYYGMPTNEATILSLLHTSDAAASFQELAQVAQDHYGLRAYGFALSVDMLKSLQQPVLVYLRVRGRDHFSVLRGVDDAGRVWLADPSWGNRLLTAHQFRSMWSTRSDPIYIGKILLLGGSEPQNPHYFVRESLHGHIRRSTCRNCGSGLL